MHYSFGPIERGIAVLQFCLPFYPDLNISDGNFIIGPHLIFQIDWPRPKRTYFDFTAKIKRKSTSSILSNISPKAGQQIFAKHKFQNEKLRFHLEASFAEQRYFEFSRHSQYFHPTNINWTFF